MTTEERGNSGKNAFVIMPFRPIYDALYEAVISSTFAGLGYKTSRADEIFEPHPVVLDIQRGIVNADVVLCELSERNPNVYYELGLAHAIGKPSILMANDPKAVPFDVAHIRCIIYNTVSHGWETEFSDRLRCAVRAVEAADEVWPPPLVGEASTRDAQQILAVLDEIEMNRSRIEELVERGYRVVNGRVQSRDGSAGWLDVTYCITAAFDALEARCALGRLPEPSKHTIYRLYDCFYSVTERAKDLSEAFRPWRAEAYLKAVEATARSLSAATETLQMLRATPNKRDAGGGV